MSNLFGDVTPLLLLGMIAGLTEFSKKFGLKDNGVLIFAILSGIVLGAFFQVTAMYPEFLGIWFKVGIYSVLFGLTAAGLYDLGTGKNRT
jgi:hypothetical protein